MARDSWLNWTITTAVLAGAGFSVGLHRFVWAIFWVATLVWWGLMSMGGHQQSGDELIIWWGLILVPPLVISLVLYLIEGIVLSALNRTRSDAAAAEPSIPPSSGTRRVVGGIVVEE